VADGGTGFNLAGPAPLCPCDDGRSALVEIIDDLEEIATLLTGGRGEAPNRRG
jgi:hypothetical protein